MQHRLHRYYKMWNPNAGANWFIFDRTTGEKVDGCMDVEKSNDLISNLNKKDREARGIKEPSNEVEVSSTYNGFRSHDAIAIGPMPIHK